MNINNSTSYGIDPQIHQPDSGATPVSRQSQHAYPPPSSSFPYPGCGTSSFDKRRFEIPRTEIDIGNGNRYEQIPLVNRHLAERLGIREGTTMLGGGKGSLPIRLGQKIAANGNPADEFVAIKEFADEQTAAMEFYRHQLIGDDPEFIKAHDMGQVDSKKFYVFLELMSGPNVFELLSGILKNPELSFAVKEQEIKKIFFQCLAPVGKSHAKGIAHGDVHPGNYLSNGQGRIALGDYGNSMVFDPYVHGCANPEEFMEYTMLFSDTQEKDNKDLGATFQMMYNQVQQSGMQIDSLARVINNLKGGSTTAFHLYQNWTTQVDG